MPREPSLELEQERPPRSLRVILSLRLLVLDRAGCHTYICCIDLIWGSPLCSNDWQDNTLTESTNFSSCNSAVHIPRRSHQTNARDYARQRQHRNDGMRRPEAPRAVALEPVVVRGRRASVTALVDVLVVDLLRQELRKQERPDRRREAVEEHVVGAHVRHPEDLPGEQDQHRPDHPERESGEGAPQREARRGRRRGEDEVRRRADERGEEEEDGPGHAHAAVRRAAAEEPGDLPLEGEFAEDARYDPFAGKGARRMVLLSPPHI